MLYRASHDRKESLVPRHVSVFAWASIVILTACRRDNPPTENTSNTATVSTGVIGVDPSAAPSSIAEFAPSIAPEVPKEKPPEVFVLPSWARDPPQPPGVAALFARGITGPIQDTFEGLLACKITVLSTGWDPVIPFIGSSSDAYPDIRIEYGNALVYLPPDTPGGTFAFSGMKLTQSSRLHIEVVDVDLGPNDTIGKVTLDACNGFPLEATTGSMKLVCRGVPRSTLTAQIKPVEAALERALTAMEKAPVKIDLDRPEASRKGIEAAQKAVLNLVTYVGFDDEKIHAAIKRIGVVEAAQEERYAALIDAEIGKHPLTEFQALPSGRVRCDATKPNMVEVEVGARPLKHEWSPKNLGPLEFRFITKKGREFAPTFDDLFVDGKKLDSSDVTIPAKGTVSVELYAASPRERPYAIVVREGRKRVILCRAP